jgi:DNA-directed RNA polymerase specialized sigma24 family protein
MHTETSEDLLVIITMQLDEPQAAERAFSEFYRRFTNYMWAVAWQLTSTIDERHRQFVAENIFSDSFRDVFRNYDRPSYFDPSQCEDSEKGIKVWLAGIAKNHFKRHFDSETHLAPISYLESYPDHPFFEEESDDNHHESPEYAVLQQALMNTLSSKEREILLITFQFRKGEKLPYDIKESLCQAYGILPNTLFVIKRRAKEKLEKYLRDHGHLSIPKIQSNV